nr:gibberellin-regulated protein 6-like [Ipomoea batatas]GMD37603.1 gibberellin-regulated protein 6-like [Ipomoea batatas]
MAKLASMVVLVILVISMLSATILASKTRNHNGGSGYGPGSLNPTQCLPQCTRRCSQTQYHKPCMFFCQKCCKKCLCVPPGFYGNKGVCPCYNNWKTKEGGPKCP